MQNWGWDHTLRPRILLLLYSFSFAQYAKNHPYIPVPNTHSMFREGLISGLEGEELIWLGRRNQEEVWNMEDKIMEILEISKKKQPEAFNPLEVFLICVARMP